VEILQADLAKKQIDSFKKKRPNVLAKCGGINTLVGIYFNSFGVGNLAFSLKTTEIA